MSFSALFIVLYTGRNKETLWRKKVFYIPNDWTLFQKSHIKRIEKEYMFRSEQFETAPLQPDNAHMFWNTPGPRQRRKKVLFGDIETVTRGSSSRADQWFAELFEANLILQSF